MHLRKSGQLESELHHLSVETIKEVAEDMADGTTRIWGTRWVIGKIPIESARKH